MKIKQFIYCTPYNIEGIKPIKELTNKFGVIEYFYLLNNSNLLTFKASEFDRDFKEGNNLDFEWLLNRYAVCIVNNDYLMNRFINKDNFYIMDRSKWTKTNVVVS
jgi:hypothetical protein